MITQEKMLWSLKNSLNVFFKEMCGDQFGEFVWGILGLKGLSIPARVNNNNNSTICCSRKYPYSNHMGFVLVWALPTPPSLVLHVGFFGKLVLWDPFPCPSGFFSEPPGAGNRYFPESRMLTVKHHTCFSYHLNKVFSKEGKLYSATICSELSSWNTPITQDTNQKRIIYCWTYM